MGDMTTMKEDACQLAYYFLIAAILASVFSCSMAHAADEQFKMNINISGTVIATGSCTFDAGSGSDVVVDFGDVHYWALNQSDVGDKLQLMGEYRRPLNSAMTCSGDTEGTTTMTFKGNMNSLQSYEGAYVLPVKVGTDPRNIGIRLLVDGKAQNVDEPFIVDMASPPVLEAELVQTGIIYPDDIKSGDSLQASATLIMAFQ